MRSVRDAEANCSGESIRICPSASSAPGGIDTSTPPTRIDPPSVTVASPFPTEVQAAATSMAAATAARARIPFADVTTQTYATGAALCPLSIEPRTVGNQVTIDMPTTLALVEEANV
ncbi:MAG: hypothetical protein GXP35_11185 [Actinobacteria bacterium]|nr:hypothetical protein [Actinomycetota bacterium]